MPTFCGKRTLSPQVGSRPTRAWVSAKRACSEAIRMSQYSASSSPPVTAAPLIAPIAGEDDDVDVVVGLGVGQRREKPIP